MPLKAMPAVVAWLGMIAAFVFAAPRVDDIPDVTGWVSDHLSRWEIVFPLAVIVPTALILLWAEHHVTGPSKEYLGGLFADPLE